MALFIPWVIRNWGKFLQDIKKAKFLLIIFLTLVLLNLVFSSQLPLSAIKWLKVLELVLLGIYINVRKDIFTQKNISIVLFSSLTFVSLVGILQFVRGQTLGSLLYFVGERSFSIFTPGIALVNILGKNYLRAYSTFPHPNALAGFIGALLLFLFPSIVKQKNLLIKIALLLVALTFVLTFSLSSFVGIVICSLIYYFSKCQTLIKKIPNFIIVLFFIVSLVFSYLAGPVLKTSSQFSKSTTERLELADVSVKVFSNHWLVGTGLNTFIPNEVKFADREKDIWLLQPVHNIYLLILTETGVLGMLLLYILLSKLLATATRQPKSNIYLAILFIFITSLFDHYWFTSQQNLLLLPLLFGISFREKN